MSYSILREYNTLMKKKTELSRSIDQLPIGYISEKTIKGKKQFYLQRRVNGKLVSTYIKASEVESVRTEIEERKKKTAELQTVDARLEQLEAAAKIIGNDLYCQLILCKMSAGMDVLDDYQKDECISFGTAMNAIEGVFVSHEAEARIRAWKKGEKTFLTVFEETLRQYGFPTEVRV